jgi:hypothetical protein
MIQFVIDEWKILSCDLLCQPSLFLSFYTTSIHDIAVWFDEEYVKAGIFSIWWSVSGGCFNLIAFCDHIESSLFICYTWFPVSIYMSNLKWRNNGCKTFFRNSPCCTDYANLETITISYFICHLELYSCGSCFHACLIYRRLVTYL